MAHTSVWSTVVLVGALLAASAAACHLMWASGKRAAQCGGTNLTAPPELHETTQVLDLSCNPLLSLRKNAFVDIGLINLQRLNLSSCQLSALDERAFCSLELLAHLDLSHNQLAVLSPRWVEDTPHLQWLRLTGNRIARVADDTFLTLAHLQMLEFNDNEIVDVAPRAFAGLETSLRRLNLGGNKLPTVNAASFTSLQSLERLELANNPWECTCGVRTLLEWTRMQRIMTSGAPYCEPTLADACGALATPRVVMLECRVSGTPATSLLWSRTGLPLADGAGAGVEVKSPVTLQTDADGNSFTLISRAPHAQLQLTV